MLNPLHHHHHHHHHRCRRRQPYRQPDHWPCHLLNRNPSAVEFLYWNREIVCTRLTAKFIYTPSVKVLVRLTPLFRRLQKVNNICSATGCTTGPALGRPPPPPPLPFSARSAPLPPPAPAPPALPQAGRRQHHLLRFCNDHCLCSESRDVRRQVRWGGCGAGTTSRVSGKAMDRFQCIWVAMIGKIYELIVEYLRNGFR